MLQTKIVNVSHVAEKNYQCESFPKEGDKKYKCESCGNHFLKL